MKPIWAILGHSLRRLNKQKACFDVERLSGGIAVCWTLFLTLWNRNRVGVAVQAWVGAATRGASCH